MSKDVDLSSKEWRDLVFEGRNQEYGAYDLRKNSDKRHNKSMILVIIALALIIVVGLTFNTVSNFIFQEDIKDEANQELVNVNMAAEEEEEEEEEQERVEMEQPEALPEEILNTIKVTELAIVEDSEVTPEDEIKSNY